MANLQPFVYSGFYDYPLAIAIQHGGKQYLLWREFNDEIDDFPAMYQVMVLPEPVENAREVNWQDLPALAIERLGELSVFEIVFDPSRRRELDPSAVDRLINPSPT